MNLSRRRFLGTATTAAAGAAFGVMPTLGRTLAPSDSLRFGLIGVNGMGWANLRSHLTVPGVSCTALCDVDSNVLGRRAAELEQMTGKAPVTYGDYRRMLENPDLDFVVIATPDHWHCLQMVHACEAGKDVYVEKPLANSIGECEIMVRAAERYDRVVQVEIGRAHV